MRCGREGVPGEERPASPGRVRRRRVVVRGETRGEGRGTRRVRDGATPLASARPAQGVVEGRITIVQDDRIRLLDETGRGYLFVVKKRRASLAELERWRDAGAVVRVRYVGQPDAGALAIGLEAVRAPSPGGDG